MGWWSKGKSKLVYKVSVLMIPTGNEFLFVGKKSRITELHIFLIFGNISDLESGLCD